jgi:hypothetical protein
MKRFYCPQKDESVVPWDSLSPDDQNFLRDKYPDAGQGAVCDLCVHSARPSSFFGRRSLSTSSSAPQSLDSGLQLPSAPLVVSGAATPLATESVEPGVVEPAASGAESSTAATGSPLDHCLVLPPVSSGTMYRRRDDCKSVLHTHPAHSGMQMGSLCAFIFFQKALFVHGEPIFSGRHVKKKCKKIAICKQWN